MTTDVFLDAIDPSTVPGRTYVVVQLVGDNSDPIVGYAPGGVVVADLEQTTDVDGVFTASLVANSDIIPTGTAYKATIIPGGQQRRSTILFEVPDTGGPYDVADLAIDTPGAQAINTRYVIHDEDIAPLEQDDLLGVVSNIAGVVTVGPQVVDLPAQMVAQATPPDETEFPFWADTSRPSQIGPPLVPGINDYVTAIHSGRSAGTLTLDQAVMSPLWIPTPMSFDKIAAEVTGGADAACTLRVGLIRHSWTLGRPSTTETDASALLTAASTGLRSADIVIDIDEPDLYWLVAVCQGVATSSWRRANAAPEVPNTTPIGSAQSIAYTQSGVTSTLPPSWTAAGTASTFPIVWLRRSA